MDKNGEVDCKWSNWSGVAVPIPTLPACVTVSTSLVGLPLVFIVPNPKETVASAPPALFKLVKDVLPEFWA